MITVLGSINMDLIAKVERFPKPGETVGGQAFSTSAGGKGANQALAARRAGAGVVLYGAVGKDHFAEQSLELLKAENVNLDAVRTVDDVTGIAMILVDASGENQITVVPGANGRLDRIDSAYAVQQMNPGDHLLLQMEIPADALRTALHGREKSRGRDQSWHGRVQGDRRERIAGDRNAAIAHSTGKSRKPAAHNHTAA